MLSVRHRLSFDLRIAGKALRSATGHNADRRGFPHNKVAPNVNAALLASSDLPFEANPHTYIHLSCLVPLKTPCELVFA